MFSSNVCSKEQEERCRKQDGSEKILQWSCSQCEKKKSDKISPYTYYLLRMRRLLKCGFPFKENDFPLETWEDIALIDEMIELKTKVF